jgi:hypothetical protein
MSLNPAQALPGPYLFPESAMKKPPTLNQQLADLKISELRSIQRVQAKQERMLRLLKRSQADRVSYAGLEYCTAEYCGRVNCSEACWFGTLKRRVRQVQAIRRLMEQVEPPLHKVIAWKQDWGCPYDWLCYIKPRIAKALMTRLFNSMCSISVTAVGTVKIVPFGMPDNRYLVEIHMIIGGANEEELVNAFRAIPAIGFTISQIEEVNRAIDEVTSCNSPRLRVPFDDPPEPAQLAEFCAWLAKMKIGTRIFRYGCDENFELITYRKIKFNPRPKKVRKPGRRNYYRKRRKRKPFRPWDMSSPKDLAYLDD